MKTCCNLRSLFFHETGASMLEYALLAALIATVAIAGVSYTGTRIKKEAIVVGCTLAIPEICIGGSLGCLTNTGGVWDGQPCPLWCECLAIRCVDGDGADGRCAWFE